MLPQGANYIAKNFTARQLKRFRDIIARSDYNWVHPVAVEFPEKSGRFDVYCYCGESVAGQMWGFYCGWNEARKPRGYQGY